MTLLESRVASVPMDDPGFKLQIRASGDFMGWRSHAVKKEPWTLQWLAQIPPDGVLYDVGACVGSYSLMAAARGVKVVAIEPVPLNYAECVANVRLNNLSRRITVLNCAAGLSTTPITLFTKLTPGYGLASERRRTHEQVQVVVPVRRLDDIAAQYGAPTHIKVDVEGAEREVISGARDILDTVTSVICEIRDDYNEKWVVRRMRGRGLESVWNGGRRTEEERTHVFERVNRKDTVISVGG